MALEEALREACKRGLTHLSVHPVQSEDGKTTYWRATATPSTMHKYVSTSSTDPIEAIVEVLKAMPKAPARKIPTMGKTPQTEEFFTAAVSDPMPHTVPDVLPGDLDEWSRFK